MREPGLFDLIFYGTMLSIMAVIAVIELVFYWRRFRSRNWPTAIATIRKDFVGRVGRGARAGFFKYDFTAQGTQHSGRFATLDSEEHALKLQDRLDGLAISIRYNPRHPQVSFLLDLYDLRFDGPAATQNPFWFINASELPGIRTLNLSGK